MKHYYRVTWLVMAALCLCAGVNQAFSQKSIKGKSTPVTTNAPAAPAAPQALVVENFDLAAGTLLTNSGFVAHSGGGTNAISVTSPGLTFSGYASSGIGNAVSLTTSGEDVNRPFPAQTSGSVYAAFMVNVTDAAADAIGGYFFHLGPDPIGTTFRGRVYIKKDTTTNNISFGITKASTSVVNDITYTPFNFSLNTTYLLVVKYTVVAGVTNDTVDLFINPTLGGAEPAATISAPDIIATDINPGSFALRQGTAATHPTVRVDGIRIGTSWASLFTPARAPLGDFNGDGRTDYALVRATGGQLVWWIQHNGSSGQTVAQFGLSTDRPIPADYDGDGRADIAVWREAPATQAAFYIFQSSTGTVRIELFGQTGDNPSAVGDWDGDGKTDVAVYRNGATIGAQSVFYYRGSLSNPTGAVSNIPWGTNGGPVIGDFPAVGDYDGDGKTDACIVRTPGGAGSQAQFILRRSSDGIAEYVNWGLQTDAGMPGDYDGDGRTDFCALRVNGSVANAYILERDGGGTGGSPIVFGNVTTDLLAPGDYDGDGKMDLVVWRPNADPAQNFFWVRQSSNSLFTTFEWGQTGDEPVTDYIVIGN